MASSIDDFYDEFVENQSKEAEILEKAGMSLDADDLKVLKKRISGKKEKAKGKSVAGKSEESFSVVDDPDAKPKIVITPKLLEKFWEELEKLDPSTLISDDVLDAFKYVGFDPDTVLRELMARGKTAGKDHPQIIKDIVDMVTIAIIKGSITEKNLAKTSDAGKVMYSGLQKSYQIQTGGTKGKDSTHLTIARVAAAMPGLVSQVLIKKPMYAKSFVGPFQSRVLPPYLKHQSAAACIPNGISDKLKDYLLHIITAYTADQSKVLSGSKDASDVLFDTQMNYVMTTFGSAHPTEETRAKIFKNYSLESDFEKINMVAEKIKKVKTDFVLLTQQQLAEEKSKS
nr:MAG: nucleocapsid protein [Xiaogan phenui-like virus 1]